MVEAVGPDQPAVEPDGRRGTAGGDRTVEIAQVVVVVARVGHRWRIGRSTLPSAGKVDQNAAASRRTASRSSAGVRSPPAAGGGTTPGRRHRTRRTRPARRARPARRLGRRGRPRRSCRRPAVATGTARPRGRMTEKAPGRAVFSASTRTWARPAYSARARSSTPSNHPGSVSTRRSISVWATVEVWASRRLRSRSTWGDQMLGQDQPTDSPTGSEGLGEGVHHDGPVGVVEHPQALLMPRETLFSVGVVEDQMESVAVRQLDQFPAPVRGQGALRGLWKSGTV